MSAGADRPASGMQGSDASPRSRSSSRRITLLKGAVTLLVVLFLFLRLDLRDVPRLLAGLRLPPFIMAVALLAGSHMVVALVWRYLLDRVGVGLRVERAVRLYYAGLFLNIFFPGSLGGDSYRVWSVYRETGEGRATLAATLVERLVGLASLCLLGAVAVALRFSELPSAYGPLLLLITTGGALLSLGVLVAPGLVSWLSRPLIFLTRGLLRERVEGVLDAMRRVGRPGPIAAALVVTLAAQGVRIWTHWWCARALGIGVEAADIYVAIPLVAVAAGLPISVGGLGVREGSGVLLLAPLGIGNAEAVAMEFLAYLVGVATSLLGGLAFLLGTEERPSRAANVEAAPSREKTS